MPEFIREALRRYLDGELSLAELDLELAGFDWNDASPEAVAAQPSVGELQHLAVLAGEGLIGPGACNLPRQRSHPCCRGALHAPASLLHGRGAG